MNLSTIKGNASHQESHATAMSIIDISCIWKTDQVNATNSYKEITEALAAQIDLEQNSDISLLTFASMCQRIITTHFLNVKLSERES